MELKNVSGNKTVIVSPFFPFSQELADELVKKIFPSTQRLDIFHLDYENNCNANNLQTELYKIVSTSTTPVYIISFGVFSFTIGELLRCFSENIEAVLFVEPDFTGAIIQNNYKKSFLKNFIRNQLAKEYANSQKIPSKFLYKGNSNGFIDFFTSLQEIPKQVKLADYITKRVKMSVIWATMDRDSWPLPLILTEDYNVPVLKIAENIPLFIEKNHRIAIENFI